MKVSTKGRYGLRALVDIATHMQGAPISLVHIAKRQNISLNYLEQVFGQLRKAGILKSVKGPNGGYLIERELSNITVREVLEVLEGPFMITDDAKDKQPDVLQQAIQSLVWDEINSRVNDYLGELTLEQLVQEYRQKTEGQEIMYYI